MNGLAVYNWRSPSSTLPMKTEALTGGDMGMIAENLEVTCLARENAYLKAQLEIIRKERDDYYNSLRESQKLHDYLIIMFNRILQNLTVTAKGVE